ncbi:MAG: hypothetical protein JRC92_00920 [Deltaproteobacteria bacterium]|nr:hypothetical protein [Deltaproteobacteria bacterium]
MKEKKLKVLIASPQAGERAIIGRVFSQAGHAVGEVAGYEAALEKLRQDGFNLLIVAEVFNGGSGLELITAALRLDYTINSGLITSMDKKSFHEATDGLGLAGLIPWPVDEAGAADFLATIEDLRQALNRR